MSSYALLNEIWTLDPFKPTEAPACSLTKCKLDNIMDAYMKEPSSTCEEEQPPIEKPCVDVDHLEGWDNSHLLKNAYDISADYKKEVELITPKEEHTDVTYCEEEHVPKPFNKTDIYTNILEKYSNQAQASNPQDPNTYYIELAIYVLSGIFLIFLMEQILQIGRHLKL